MRLRGCLCDKPVQNIHWWTGPQPEQWFHVDSVDNPADDGSPTIWMAGPDFLRFQLNVPEHNPMVSAEDGEVNGLVS